ncbi:hypothetical protein [Tessaracoccus massiliensis]|uniref:WXG100-like domain-containing protein n=1 Tax=Tessaracoccus massiliensis TaxID=1522311 RepID=UPI00058E2BAD|nr:hypothetical protein [Tessaracoccus massiliensis]
MAMMLPGWLGEALNYLGFNWPLSNEDVLTLWGGEFRTLAAEGRTLETEISQAVTHITSHNHGPTADAFVGCVRDGDSNLEALRSFIQACDIAAGVCDVCSGIVITLKGVFIAQLIIMAASLASGPGALIVREIVRRAINAGIEVAADQILEEAL